MIRDGAPRMRLQSTKDWESAGQRGWDDTHWREARMRRRAVVAGALGLAARPGSLAAQQAKVPRVGVLALGNPHPLDFWLAFKADLRALGYVEGTSIVLTLMSAEGKAEALPDLATKLVRANFDVIVAFQTPAAHAAKRATQTVPIVMANVGAPLATGLVTSFIRPEGNITGSSAVGAETAGKNLEMIRELLPTARGLAVLANMDDPFTAPFLQQIEEAAASGQRFEVRSYTVHPTDELDAVFARMESEKCDVGMMQPSLLRPKVYELLDKHRLPATSIVRGFAEAGGLMSYGANLRDVYRTAAFYVDRILKGAKPGNLPIQQPATFELVINLRTAKTLGLTVPPALLARADDVIE